MTTENFSKVEFGRLKVGQIFHSRGGNFVKLPLKPRNGKMTNASAGDDNYLFVKDDKRVYIKLTDREVKQKNERRLFESLGSNNRLPA